MNNLIWLCVVVVLATWVCTFLFRKYALFKELMDVPNSRSSHSIPTPRGGGVAVVLTFLAALLYLALNGEIDQSIAIALFVSGGAVAAIGFFDDHRHIAARWRLLVHLLAASWIVYTFNGLPPIQIIGVTIDIAWLGYLLSGLYLVWLLNLYNFMDGIDGIASIEAITVCIGGIVLLLQVNAESQLYIPLLLLLSAVIGFLFWNFPRAKIFMGDAGSGFIGIVLGALSLQSAWLEPKLFWAWLILLGVFLVDATFTLTRRVLRGDKFYEAHRIHAYQHAARQLNSHIRVTIGIGLINLFWLLPLAMLVTTEYLSGVVGLTIAYIPLIILEIKYRAGETDLKNN